VTGVPYDSAMTYEIEDYFGKGWGLSDCSKEQLD